MPYTLENEELRITIREQGAELRALTEVSDGTEYLWNGDPAWWKYSAPVLFPIVGKLVDGTYQAEGGNYALPAHGLGRISDFALVRQSAGEVVFALTWSEASLAQYPYKFRLEITYRLNGRTVEVEWRVKNLDTKTMYFSIGAHPAFRCPIQDGETMEDCYLEFNRTEQAEKLALAPGCLLTHTRVPALKGKVQQLSDTFFQDGVLVFDQLQSDAITIRSRRSAKSLTISAPGFPYWGLWSPEQGGAPFICIEPWYGHADYSDASGDFAAKEGNQQLAPGAVFQAAYTIAVGRD